MDPSNMDSATTEGAHIYPKITLSEHLQNDNNSLANKSLSSTSTEGEPSQTHKVIEAINSGHEASSSAAIPGTSSPNRTASTGSIQDSLNIHANSHNDTDSILNSLNRKNKNLAPVFTRDYYGGSSTFPTGEALKKGWKGLSSLEKSLSVALGVVSTLAVALMIAVIVVGVQLNDKDNCKLSFTPETTACPTLPSTTPRDDRCDLERPRPPRRSTRKPLINSVGGEEGGASAAEAASCIVSSDNNSTICLTPACFRLAGGIIQSIDFDTDPCENFYQFACGGRIKNNPALEIVDQSQSIHKRLLWKIKDILEARSQQQNDTFSRSFRLAQQFYHSCMNPMLDDEVALAEMRVLLDTMTSTSTRPEQGNGNPVEISPKLQTVAAVLANIRRYLNGNFIIHVDVSADDKNSKEHAIYLHSPEFTLPHLLKDLGITANDMDDESGGMQSQQKRVQIQNFYRVLVKKLWTLVYPEDVANLENVLQKMDEFEQKLQSISQDDGAKQENPQEAYNPLSQLKSTQQLSPLMVGWLTEFTRNVITDKDSSDEQTNKTQGSVGSQGQGQGKIPNVVVKNVKYFKELEAILNETDAQIIGKYLKLRILLSYAPHSGDVLLEPLVEFEKKVEGTKAQPFIPRWQTCAKETNEFFGWVVSRQLVQSSRDTMSAIQQHLSESGDYLKESLNETLSSKVDWFFTNEIRLAALKKLEQMETYLGFPTEWVISSSGRNLNTTKISNFVEEFYSDMNFTDPLNYMQNYVEMRMWLAKKQLAQAYQPTLQAGFRDIPWPKLYYPSSSEAVYSEKLNYLALPVGVIDTALLHSPSVQYGSLGVLMAQLMLQGFDEQGSYRSSLGNIDPWWDVDTRENYRNLSECFRDQFNEMSTITTEDGNVGVEIENVTKNSISQRNLLRQLVLQNGALALAYEAYQSNTFDHEFEENLLPGLQDYTPEQLFFLSFTQSQCSSSLSASSTSKVVAENALKNSVEFARHWKCPLPVEDNICRLF